MEIVCPIHGVAEESENYVGQCKFCGHARKREYTADMRERSAARERGSIEAMKRRPTSRSMVNFQNDQRVPCNQCGYVPVDAHDIATHKWREHPLYPGMPREHFSMNPSYMGNRYNP